MLRGLSGREFRREDTLARVSCPLPTFTFMKFEKSKSSVQYFEEWHGQKCTSIFLSLYITLDHNYHMYPEPEVTNISEFYSYFVLLEIECSI